MGNLNLTFKLKPKRKKNIHTEYQVLIPTSITGSIKRIHKYISLFVKKNCKK